MTLCYVRVNIYCSRYVYVSREKNTKNIGVPQGDCLSPILFTLYLADVLETERSRITEESNYSKILMNSEDLFQAHLKDHTYSLPKENRNTNRSTVCR